MYIVDGVAYAGEQAKPVTVTSVRPLDGYRLWLRFSTGETKLFDATPLLVTEAFQPLRDTARFRSVYVDFGIPTWDNGAIDIAPEHLYRHSVMA